MNASYSIPHAMRSVLHVQDCVCCGVVIDVDIVFMLEEGLLN